MIKYLKTDPWLIIEEGFKRVHHRSSESIFSIGNGRFGQRANHEEKYSGPTLQGSYVAGVYYPDKTRVGWWKNGYPEYFAKVLNSTNWIGINVFIDGEELDFGKLTIADFRRELDMKQGLLRRSFLVHMNESLIGNRDGADTKQVKVVVERFCSMADDETAVIRYTVTPINFSGTVRFEPFLDGDVRNHDSNYDESFWEHVASDSAGGSGVVTTRTRKTEFELSVAMEIRAEYKGKEFKPGFHHTHKDFYSENSFEKEVQQGEDITLYKYIGLISSLNCDVVEVPKKALEASHRAAQSGYIGMRDKHISKWSDIWDLADIVIEGDEEAQQAIRFNIFHLNQTFTGEDHRLNIGPKGFTGEKYGGSTYWDTEAYCIPFYMATKNSNVARQLLVYRYNQLDKAIENASKLGFINGAALYPMVTMNGEECHNEWEITFEEIHRNGAIAYAVWNYVKYTSDHDYLSEYGLEVLIAIARFWSQRVHWSASKELYVMHGVTGPNEYENNVNNNWYTSYIATWCLRYCIEVIEWVKKNEPASYSRIAKKCSFDEKSEVSLWKQIDEKMYYGIKEGSRVFLQQDGFLDKELRRADSLPKEQRPINQHWSWDRILRSCFIKQADVLQGLYFFEEDFDEQTLRDNFDFYEPMTVHESSLSPCVHSILAAQLGYEEKAYEMYVRTARLDLDDYNHEAHEGLHITSMAGTWMSIVQGFGGMRVKDGEVIFQPILPTKWKSYSFNILFRGERVEVKVNANGVEVNKRAQN
ncbi:MAG: family 65 glycosyl hydrolase domain-containing protein [Flavobacteriales bacterium]|nr:family 65 glycosyl hydrolase domain-containing protein [Flavobacteriales bacterium]